MTTIDYSVETGVIGNGNGYYSYFGKYKIFGLKCKDLMSTDLKFKFKYLDQAWSR